MVKAKSGSSRVAAEKIATFIRDAGLTNPYGGDAQEVQKTTKNKPNSTRKIYRVGFSYPANLDGEVEVYGEKFILIHYQTRYLDLPHKDNRVYDSVTDAIDFLRLAFVELKFQEALGIPLKR